MKRGYDTCDCECVTCLYYKDCDDNMRSPFDEEEDDGRDKGNSAGR